MSRIGKQPIAIPEGVVVTVQDGIATVRGPRGELSRAVPRGIVVTVGHSAISVSGGADNSALWGTAAAHLKNMVGGVTGGFKKQLVIQGIGYRAEASGGMLKLQVGFSHPVTIPIPDGIAVEVQKELLTVSGIDKERVGEFAAVVRRVRPPEPYKGKGIRYEGEIVRRKEGKKAVGTSG